MKGRIRAIDRYDGPAFRVLRKYLREEPDGELSILILSAKFGLIDFKHKIPYYEQRLSRTSATGLKPQVLASARHSLRSRRWRAVGVSASKQYLCVLNGLEALIGPKVKFDVLVGGLGKRLSALRNWLRQ
jgi:hypothetical protein